MSTWSGDELRFDHGDETPQRLKTQLSRLVGMTAIQMGRVAGTALSEVGAHKNHYIVLAALAELGPASQAVLSGRTRIYKSDLVAVLNELADGGWVRRAPDPSDKRRNVITVTEAGQRHLVELDGVLAAVNEHIMAPLDHDERTRLFELLNRINGHLAASDDAPHPTTPGR
ncbi:DNA-binding MarR family transcriptional regulator [Stackebrandtia endophytica]|uniref:DNA-binding MarR family transcriptional regulator n=1 Tax=Stackebrandtia endophytica TaxID=1496996 RepID=A0A543AWK9_9ACTN|nr:MarR family winged helix-turn-helix transcriptional regulator [Stackebrandtia endophytica]TQL76940.1 DNA-binding MarR family transcriptional regulator [Stackebrandtia endophytica]